MFSFLKNFSKKKILSEENIKLINQDLIKYDLVSIKNHIKNKIFETNIENLQSIDFNYMHIKNLLPDDYYNQLTKFIHNNTSHLAKTKMYKNDTTNILYVDIIGYTFATEESDEIKKFLRDLNTIFQLIGLEIWKKFEFKKHTNNYENVKLTPFAQILVRKNKQFSINPHLHGKTEILDCLFYFPDSNIDKDHGTIIYEKINNEIKVGNRVEYEGFDIKNFKIAKKFDYIPNTVVAWINNEKSFHGANPDWKPAKENKKNIFFGLRKA